MADEELACRLRSSGAVQIEGAKACGKTETARQISASEVLLDVDPDARLAVEIDPSLVLAGDTPRLIDEWQVAPEIWNHVRRAVDDRGEPGQFILAGSATPADDATRHTGAGRISRLRMRPMSLFESGLSDGSISLGDLLEGGTAAAGDRDIELPDLAEALARGGWPAVQRLPVDAAIEGAADYLEEICHTEVNRVDGVRRDPARVRRLLQSLARNVSTHVAMTTLAADAATGGSDPLKPETVGEYLEALKRLFVVEDQLPWEPHLRSRSILRKSAKRHFVDPSLAVAALGADPAALLRDLNLFGLLFESLVVRDLRVYAQPGRGEVRQFLDNKGLEVDAIVERDGSWGAFEIKLGGEKPIEQAAASLRKFAAEIDTRRSGAPAFLAVIVPTGYGYVREDGSRSSRSPLTAHRSPLTALRPDGLPRLHRGVCAVGAKADRVAGCIDRPRSGQMVTIAEPMRRSRRPPFWSLHPHRLGPGDAVADGSGVAGGPDRGPHPLAVLAGGAGGAAGGHRRGPPRPRSHGLRRSGDAA